MDRSYWEKIAPEYNTEIFDVFQNDKKGIILSTIKQFSSQEKTVIDIGCAIGKWLPVLSPAFKKVVAIDISLKNLQIAEKLFPEYKNVEYGRVDMSNARAKMKKCDFAICINAILTDSLKKRIIFFNNLKNSVKKDGHLVLVIPSLESSMLTSIIRHRWNPDKDASSYISKSKKSRQFINLLNGNAELDNVPTKHYLKEELELLLKNEGFDAIEIKKIEYDWKTEFYNPPKWLRNPRPWDWMVLARKN